MDAEGARVCVIALGVESREALRPIIELCKGLLDPSHKQPDILRVSVLTHAKFEPIVHNNGVAFADVGACPVEALYPSLGQLFQGGADQVSARARPILKPLIEQWVDATTSFIEKYEIDLVILCGHWSVFCLAGLFQNTRTSTVLFDTTPMVPTAAFGCPWGFDKSFSDSPIINQMHWRVWSESMWSFMLKDVVNETLKDRGFPIYDDPFGPWEFTRTQPPVIHAFSASLIPHPLDWHAKVHTIGPLFGEAIPPEGDLKSESLPISIKQFLDGRIPCVFIDLGSTFYEWGTPQSRQRLLVQCILASRSAQCRTLVLCPHNTKLPPQISQADDVHVIPDGGLPAGTEMVCWRQCAAVMCGGDAWTVQATLRCGTMSVVIDVTSSDSPVRFWGHVIEKLDAGKYFCGDLVGLDLAMRRMIAKDSEQRANARSIGYTLRQLSADAVVKRARDVIVHEIQQPLATRLRAAQSSKTSRSHRSSIRQVMAGKMRGKKTDQKESRSPQMRPVQAPPVHSSSSAAAQQPPSSSAAQEPTGPTSHPTSTPIESSRPNAGFSFSHRYLEEQDDGSTDECTHVWTKGTHSNFRLRVGPNYKKHGKKAPSGPALFDLVDVDLMKTPAAIQDVASHVNLPSCEGLPSLPEHIPPLFIVHGVLPLETPSMMSAASDGPTFNAIFYFRIKPETAHALQDVANANAAIRLLDTFCLRAETDPNIFNRFKAIGMLRNYDKAGMPSLMKSYNGKPVLVRNRNMVKGGSGRVFRGPQHIQMEVNIRTWPYVARSALNTLFGNSRRCDLDVGFTLEGREDSELPEVLLGHIRIARVDLNDVQTFQPAS